MVFFGGFPWVFGVSRVISCLWCGVVGGNCGIFLGFWAGFCAHCGVAGFLVFRYVGECIICPSQGVMHFGAGSCF